MLTESTAIFLKPGVEPMPAKKRFRMSTMRLSACGSFKPLPVGAFLIILL
jgi:hypothetical protein